MKMITPFFVKIAPQSSTYVENSERDSIFILLPRLATGGEIKGVSGGNIFDGFRSTHFSIYVSQQDLRNLLSAVKKYQIINLPPDADESKRVEFNSKMGGGSSRTLELSFIDQTIDFDKHISWYLKDTPNAYKKLSEFMEFENQLLKLLS